MANVDFTPGSNAAPVNASQCAYKISNVVDLALGLAKKGSALASNDVIQCLDIPAKTYVQNVFVEVLTAGVATAYTATVGDGADPNGWDAAVDLEATAGTITLGDGTAAADAYPIPNGKVYSAADTIDLVLTINTATAQPKVRVTALCFDLSS